MLMRSRERITALVWVIVISIGFFGVKGGIFSLSTGFNYVVWGPNGGLIEGNNELALALIMIVPLLRFLQLNTTNNILVSQLRAHFLFGDESDIYFVVTDGRSDGTHNWTTRESTITLKISYVMQL